MLEKRMQAFQETCKQAGIKMTPQRMEIYRELARTEEHPDAETIYTRIRERMPNVSLDTIYRTLSLFEEMGLIQKVEVLSNRARFDANTDSHHHFVCKKCGVVHDFYSEEADAFTPPDEVLSLGDVETVHVQVLGICSTCKAKMK
ncbi:MAG: Fur family transcriptional regulator [bacterium]